MVDARDPTVAVVLMSTLLVTAAVADLLSIVESMELPEAASREEPRVQAMVEAARQGDREAFGDLVTLYQRLVFRTAIAALGSREDAEDAAQEAFVAAWQKLPGFRGDATFRTWLLTIVWRKALDRRRARRLWWTRTGSPRETDARDQVEELAGTLSSPEEQALSRGLADRISAEIIRLSPKLKDTFLLAMSGEHSYDEIATLLKIPIGTVKWRVAEARRIIGRKLDDPLTR